MGSNDQRGGRGRARQGDGRFGQRGGRDGHGRDGRGCGRWNAHRTFANNVNITDPHRNFSSEEWERLGSMRSYVLQLREGGRGGRGRGDGSSNSHSTTNRSTSSVTTGNNNSSSDNNTSNHNNVLTDQSIVSDITDRGSQNGRSFGRGAYNNNN